MKPPWPTVTAQATDTRPSTHIPRSNEAPGLADAIGESPRSPLVLMPAVLADAEIDQICAGLRQNAAKVRYLRDVLKIPVLRKPNGRPLVLRSDWENRAHQAQNARQAGSGPQWSKAA